MNFSNTFCVQPSLSFAINEWAVIRNSKILWTWLLYNWMYFNPHLSVIQHPLIRPAFCFLCHLWAKILPLPTTSTAPNKLEKGHQDGAAVNTFANEFINFTLFAHKILRIFSLLIRLFFIYLVFIIDILSCIFNDQPLRKTIRKFGKTLKRCPWRRICRCMRAFPFLHIEMLKR